MQKILGLAGVAIVCVVAGLWLRSGFAPEWAAADTTQSPPSLRPWAVEADCYSQLARVQRILEGKGLLQNHFAVENWPEGMAPSTTAPFDYVLLLLYFPLRLFVQHPLDWAGALVSPVLWLALAAFWTVLRSRDFNVVGRSVLLAGSAALPAIIWATAFGRPRHQSLIFVLMALALTAEYERWQIDLKPRRGWNILAGVAWGVALWTSLYEPAVVLSCIITFNFLGRRRESVAFLVSLGVVLALMCALEGGHIYANLHNIVTLRPDLRESSLRWLGTIAEVRPIAWSALAHPLAALPVILQVGILIYASLGLWRLADGNKTDALLILLGFLLTLLTLTQFRWSYYAALADLLLMARYIQSDPARWNRLLLAGLAATGIFTADFVQLHGRAALPPNQPSLQLAQIAHAIDAPGGIMAPWWLSPGLLYFSGQPIVAGSSHCGISGIVASAQFFATTSWPQAERLLRSRQVRWIVAWDDATYVYPLLDSSLGILGMPQLSDDDRAMADRTVAQSLIEDRDLPPSIRLRGVTQQCKLYEFIPNGA